MANKKLKFIGIKKLWYGDVINEALTAAKLKTWLSTAKQVTNSHDGTFNYSQDDPEVTELKNELTGNTYHRDKTSNGNKTINFSVGEYELEDKAALQGGKVIKDGDEVVGWEAPDTLDLVSKAIVAYLKTGNYVVFTNANIVGKVDNQDKNLTLGITATAQDSPVDGVADEYWFTGSAVDKSV